MVPIWLFLVVNISYVLQYNECFWRGRENLSRAYYLICRLHSLRQRSYDLLSYELDCPWWLSFQLLSQLDLLVYIQLYRAFCWRFHGGLAQWPYFFPISTLNIVFVFIPLPFSQTKGNAPCDFSHSEPNVNSFVFLFVGLFSWIQAWGLLAHFW